ncbi:MAG: SDR family NAD(P)-dependent oxidoreductase [Candidatus Altiarchaeota archaeon]
MRVLVTGGAGFIGSNISDSFLEDGNDVVIYDNMSRNGVRHNVDWLRERHGNVEVVVGDVRDFERLREAVAGADLVFHTAAQVAVTTSVEDPRMDFEVNTIGTLNVLEALRLSDLDAHLFFTSTNKVYGEMTGIGLEENDDSYDYKTLKDGISEEQTLDFHSPYGCSKGAGDQYVRDYARIYGMKNVVFRMSCIYGTRQFGTVDQGWVAHLTKSAITGEPITVYGDGKQVRDILYIDDLVKAFKNASERIKKTRGQVYNIGGGRKNVISLIELISHLEELTGKKIGYGTEDWRPGDQKVYYTNIGKAGKDFGWEPSVGKKEGVERIFDWINSNKGLF